MNASIHQHSTDEKIAFQVTHNNGSAWLTITDPGGNYLTLFFEPAAIGQIMGQMEKALGELETIAHTMDLSAAEMAPAGHSEQDGAFALPDSAGGETVVSFMERN